MSDLIQRLGVLSLTSSAVLLPLLLLAPRIQKRYAAKSLYLLWLLLSVRLLLPVELDLPRPAVTIRVPEVTYTVPVAPPAAPAAQVPAAPAGRAVPTVPASRQTAAAAPTVSLGQVLFGVWLSGTALFLAWNAVGCALARRDLLKGAEEELGDQLLLSRLWEGEHGRPAVLRSYRAAGAMSLGLFRPVVVLPEGLGPGRETEMVLRHELGHIRRRDLWYKFLLVLVNAVHWFNPLVWLMCRQAARNLEYCCDDWVVRDQDAAFRHSYGEVLLRHAAGPGTVPLYATRFGGGGELKGRIVNLFAEKKTGAVLVSLVLCAALVAGSLVACESVRAGEGASYTQKSCGVTLRLPDSWAGQFEAVDTTEAQTKFYLSEDREASLVTMMCIPLDRYPGYFPPEGERVGFRMRELGPVGDRMVVLVDFGETGGEPDETAALRAVLVEELWALGPAALETDDPVYENETYGFTLRLPKSWEGRFEAAADGEGYYVFRDTELGEGGGIFGLSIYPEPLEEERPARVRFLGGREGCWVYLDLWQSDGPAMSTAPEKAVEGYDAMYEDLLLWLDAAPTCLLTFQAGDPSDVEATPALTAQEALDELAASVRVTEDELAFTVPMGYPVPGDWKLQAAGRYDGGEMGMAVHLLDNDGNQVWEAGETYRFPLKEYNLAKFTELSLNAWLPDGRGGELEKNVDLLVRAEEQRAQRALLEQLRAAENETAPAAADALEQVRAIRGTDLYVNEDMGFSLRLPHDWMERLAVDVSRRDSAVFQYGSGGPALFTVRAVPAAEWETARTEGRDTDGTALLEAGVAGETAYLLAYPEAAPKEADQTYRDMLTQVPGLAPDLHVLGGEAGAYGAGWQWPLPGRYQISASFGSRTHPITGEQASHDGVDIPAPEGTVVLAAQGGTVAESGFDSTDGNYVLLSHDGGVTTRYTCLQSSAVAAGDGVQAGETVGYVGSTGAATGNHLHLEFAENGVRKDPLDYYPELAAEFASGGAPEGTVIDVRCDGGRELTGYSTFAVEEGQTLTVAYATDAADGGRVDLLLYGPDGARRQLTFVKGTETRTVDLPAGTWTYDCTGSSLSVCTASLVGTLG